MNRICAVDAKIMLVFMSVGSIILVHRNFEKLLGEILSVV